MMRTRMRLAAWAVSLSLMMPALVCADVSRVVIESRRDLADGQSFGAAGPYEHLVGRVYFSVDPANPRNSLIADIDKAPKNAAGRVEMSADLEIFRPRDLRKGNGVALIDIVNRGGKTVLASFNRARGGAQSPEREVGDGFLLNLGYTLVWVGWEFDVAKRAGAIRIEVPAATGTTGVVRATFTPSSRAAFMVGDLMGYTLGGGSADGNSLTVRARRESTPVQIPRDKWRLVDHTVTLEGGFEPGQLYEITYASADPPISGLGFVAVRDTAAWIKYAADPIVSATYAFAFGSSQSGRFLRDFLYHGMNTDERDRQAFDAVMAHIAGSARIDLDRRWATPISVGTYAATSFPFADATQRDPVTGVEDGLLDNARARGHQPKIFYTNTGVEYWGGGRAAALVHVTPDGSKDLALPENVRVYFFAGSQHGPAAFPPAVTNGQQKGNPNDYWWGMRALLVAMERWVRDGTAPPPSLYPRLQDGTLVRADIVAFPELPGVTSPRHVSGGTRAASRLALRDAPPGTPIPLLVPQVDADGNERAGIRLPDVAVPLATYTGWNFRSATIGAPDQLFPLLGSYVPFPRTKEERESSRDPRASIGERYQSRAAYLSLVQQAGEALVKSGYLLSDDLTGIFRRAGDHWDLFGGRPGR